MAYLINENNYFNKVQPAKSEELLNSIEVNHNPMQVQDFNDEYYKTMEAIPITPFAVVDVECVYSEPPCLEPTATVYVTNADGELNYNGVTGEISNTQLAISSVTYYAWGAALTIVGGEGFFFVVVISSTPLKSQGIEGYTAQDTSSILENGVLKYVYPKNHLIQSRVEAVDIATILLATYVVPRKDISISWRGDPAIELTDVMTIPEYNKNGIYTEGDFTVYKQVLKYDGTLKAKLDGRKVTEVSTTTSTTTGAP